MVVLSIPSLGLGSCPLSLVDLDEQCHTRLSFPFCMALHTGCRQVLWFFDTDELTAGLREDPGIRKMNNVRENVIVNVNVGKMTLKGLPKTKLLLEIVTQLPCKKGGVLLILNCFLLSGSPHRLSGWCTPP